MTSKINFKMKKLIYLTLILTILITSCNSPYKKRKRCKGNGSWYGNRNIGHQTQDLHNTYTFNNTKN